MEYSEKKIQLSPTSPKTHRVENMTAVRESLGIFISVENSLKMEPKVAKLVVVDCRILEFALLFFCVGKVKKIVTLVKR